MAKYTKLAALAQIRSRTLGCLDENHERLALSGREVAGHLHEIADTNHRYVRDYGANSLGAIVADIGVSPLVRLLRILTRIELMETALSDVK
jgi:ElaB/YqjD/DUF883 family membrane-anchored ribosome-binding protein